MRFLTFNALALDSSVAAWNGQISYGSVNDGADLVFLIDYASGSSYTGHATGIGTDSTRGLVWKLMVGRGLAN